MSLADVPNARALLLATDREKSERRYAPLEWIQAGDVPLSYSDDDLVLLGDLGMKLLTAAGVLPTDVIANLISAGATREQLQLTLGAQTYGVASIELGPDRSIDEISQLDPTVLIGDGRELTRVLDAKSLDEQTLTRLHTVIVTGAELTPRQYKAIVERLGGNKSAVIRAWAPEGVLALWGQCRGGTAFHTWPDAEVIEVVDPYTGMPTPTGMAGQVFWTSTGWYSSALVRLDTEAFVIAHTDVCPTCGRKSMRMDVVDHAGGFQEVLDSSAHIKSWVAELLRNDAGDELAIWIEPNGEATLLELLTELNLKIGEVQVHLVDAAEIERRQAESNGERFGDHRSF